MPGSVKSVDKSSVWKDTPTSAMVAVIVGDALFTITVNSSVATPPSSSVTVSVAV